DKVVPAITSALDDDNWLVRAEAANALRVIGEKAIPSLAALKNSILEPRNKSKKGVFRSAIIALEKIQTSGPEISVPEEVSVVEEPKVESEIVPTEVAPSSEVVESAEPITEISREQATVEDKEKIEDEVEDFIEDSIEDTLEDAVEEITDEKFDDDVLEDIAEEIAEEITEEIIEEPKDEPVQEVSEVTEDAIEKETVGDLSEEEITEEIQVESIESPPESVEETPQVEEEAKPEEFTTRKISKTIMKVILVGEGPVGKTSLRRKFVGDDFTHEYNEVFGADITSKQLDINGEGFVFQFWDVSTGDHSYFSSEIFFRGVNGVLLIYDISQKESFDNIKNLITEIIKLEGKELIFVLVGNKNDLRENQAIKCVSTKDGRNLAKTLSLVFGIDVPFFETSSISGDGVEDMFKTFIDEVTSQYFKRKED
ncbi:MAG: GTP-binding protein, partial [Candidatus Heimdallarchaeota archaeon]